MSTEASTALHGWRVLVLRPPATRAPLLRALAAAGATPLALPALRLLAAADRDAADRQLAAALRAPLVLFTSPAAVAFARRLPAWQPPVTAIALGSGTARALARAGSPGALQPPRADSEGVLALPALRALHGGAVGLVTAPGGRGLLAAGLAARGIRVLRADVYRRLPARLDSRHRALLRCLLDAPGPRALLLTSAEALEHLLGALAPEAPRLLPQLLVVAASERLQRLAVAHGAARVVRAASPSPPALLAALIAAAGSDAGVGAIR